MTIPTWKAMVFLKNAVNRIKELFKGQSISGLLGEGR